MAKNKRTGPEKNGVPGSSPDDFDLTPNDKKLMNGLLKGVEANLYWVDRKDKERALADLRSHVIEKSRQWNVDNSMEMALFSLGSPEVIAKGIRTLYGYSNGFKALLIMLAFLLGIPTVPIFLSWSIIFLVLLFLFISNFGVKTNVLIGGLMGVSGALSRSAMALFLIYLDPSTFVLGPTAAMGDFVMVSLFLVLVGMLAGHVRESSVKAFLSIET